MAWFSRRKSARNEEVARSAPIPTTPVEIGLSLRSAREREGLSLEEIRLRTDVPMVDLDALEQGRLDLFHVEQAAIVVLWRYAETVGLEPQSLVEVMHRAWPTPALSVDYFRVPSLISSTPVAQLAVATSLLAPILQPRPLRAGASPIGLSTSMQSVLASASRGAARAVASIGPGRPKNASPKPKGQSKALPKSASKLKSAPKQKQLTAAQLLTTPLEDTVVFEPIVVETVGVESMETVAPVESATSQATSEILQFPAPAPGLVRAGAPIEAPPVVSAPTRPTAVPFDAETTQQAPPRPVGHWASRLSKVIAQRFGVDETRD